MDAADAAPINKGVRSHYMEQRMTIRNVELDDRDAINSLSYQINQDHYENMPGDFRKPDGAGGGWEHWLAFNYDEKGIFLVADDGKSVIGFIAGRVIDSGNTSYLIKKKKLQISTIVVDKQSRGKGIGRDLVESALCAGRKLGATEVFLEVMAYNKKAQKFYEILGFGEFSSKLSMKL